MPKLALDLAWCLSMAEGSASYGGGPLRVMQEATQRKMCSLGPRPRAGDFVSPGHQVEPSL